MKPDQIILVQTSFNKVVPISATVGALFYRRLFQLDPGLRSLFTNDLRAQSRKLMAMLSLVVDNLTAFDTLLPQIQILGRAHVGYGVQNEQYATVGEALLWTLHTSLEDQFTEADAQAWAVAYNLIADAMMG